jgi:hypothetical protein
MLFVNSVNRNAANDVVREKQNLHEVQVTVLKPSTVPNGGRSKLWNVFNKTKPWSRHEINPLKWKHSTGEYTTQHNTTQHNTTQHNTTQHNTGAH